VETFDVGGTLRRIRRLADLSQRELARALDVSKSSIAVMECGDRGIDVLLLARAAELAGLRLALIDANGGEVAPMSGSSVRDTGGRLFPAHLDTYRSDERGWLHQPRRDRPETAFTFGRDRRSRDVARRAHGVPEDHHPELPGDSPEERRAARQRAARLRRQEELGRRRESGDLQPSEPFTCTCPTDCDALDDWSARPVHAPGCPCSCDIG